MKGIIAFLIPTLALAQDLPLTPFPIFLKAGFSSVLEFEESPTKVVVGDPQSFRIDKVERSLVLKPTVEYATTNLFVYFKSAPAKLFLLTASEDAAPTYYKKIEDPKPLPAPRSTPTSQTIHYERGARLLHASYSAKKDYLTVDVSVQAGSTSLLRPKWGSVRILSKGHDIPPNRLWAERKEVQKDSKIRARFIFAKPNLPLNLAGVSLVIPLEGEPALTVALSRRPR